MKKLLACLLVAVVIFSLVGCGTTPSSNSTDTEKEATIDTGAVQGNNEQIELTFWAHQEETWNDSYKEIAAEFTAKNPNITIKFDFFPYDEFESKVQTSLIAKSGGADMYELWGGWAIDFASTGALAAMPDALANEIRNDSYPSTIGALEYGGKLYGMPMEFNIECGAMLVNLKLLEKNDMTIPATWDELVDSGSKTSVIDGDEFVIKGFDFVNWDSVTYLLTSMILSSGGQYLNEDGTVDFTSGEAKEAFTELAKIVMDDKVTDLVGLTGGSDLEGYQLLYADKALFVPRGPWVIAEGVDVFELTYGEDFTYAEMPWYGPEVAFAAETGWAIAINGGSEKQEAAAKFLEYFYSDEVLLKHNINCAMIPPKKSVSQSAELLEKMPFVEPLIKILDKAQFIGYFNTDVLKEAVNDVFVDYCSGLYTNVDEALVDLETKINADL